MSVARTILRNSAALAGGRIVTKAVSLAFLGYATRVLGEAGFGRFSMAMALVGFVEFVPGYISRPYIVRYVARERERSGAFLSAVMASNVVLSIALLGVFLLVVPFLNYPPDATVAIYLLAASMLFSSLTNSDYAVLSGFERFDLVSVADVANTLMTVAAGVVVLVSGGGVIALCGAYAGARVLTWMLARRLTAPFLADKKFVKPDTALVRTMVRGAWPFFITSMFIMFYNRADIVMLSWIDSTIPRAVAVGHYNAAYKLMEALGLITSAFVVAVYPLMARRFVEGADGVAVAFRQSFRALVAFTFPVAVGTSLLAAELMATLFGKPFAAAGPALTVLIWGQVMDSVNPLAATALRAAERESQLARITGVCAIFNVGLNVVLIPRYSYMGAAVATLASFLLVYAWSMISLRGALGPLRVTDSILRGAAASAVMGAAVWWARGFGLPVAVAVGVAVYLPAAFAVGLVRVDDARMFLRRLT